MKRFYLTNHVVERFEERFRSRFKSINWGSDTAIKDKISWMIRNSSENNSFLNNQKFMLDNYNKYGYDSKFRYLCCEDVVFLAVQNKNKNREVIVTCFDNKYIVSHKKFKKNKSDFIGETFKNNSNNKRSRSAKRSSVL